MNNKNKLRSWISREQYSSTNENSNEGNNKSQLQVTGRVLSIAHIFSFRTKSFKEIIKVIFKAFAR